MNACNLIHSRKVIAIDAVQVRHFKKSNDELITVVAYSDVWTESSAVSCIMRCRREFPACFSVLFDRHNRRCTPGSWTVPTTSPRDLNKIQLYHTGAFCNTSYNFTIKTHGSLIVCTWMSTIKLTYSSAREDCEVKRAHLYTIKTLAKLQLLQTLHARDTDLLWVGLDDIQQEGVFKWVDDGAVVTDDWKNTIFHEDQPDNWKGIEDCVMYNATWGPLNDISCGHLMKYLCEAIPSLS